MRLVACQRRPTQSKLHPMKKKSASQSAFFKLRLLIGVLFCFGAITLVLFAQPRTPSGQSGSWRTAHFARPISRRYAGGEVRHFAAAAQHEATALERMYTARERGTGADSRWHRLVRLCPIRLCSGCLARLAFRCPIISFDGNSNMCGCSPPDPNGAVGPNHVVTMSNLHYQIFNKTGTSLFGPAANNTLWSGFGGACQTQNAGDPVVLYDQLADRWLLSQFTAAVRRSRMRGAFTDQRSAGILLPLGYCHRRRK